MKLESITKGGYMMFIQMKTMQIEEGFSEQVVDRFKGAGIIEQQPGFLDLSVLKKK